MKLTDVKLSLTPRDVVFSDFDATISLEDTGLAMMRHLPSDKSEIAWELEHRWRAQEIDSMQCLSEQWGLIGWSEAELLAFIDALPIDPTFDDFARHVQQAGARLVIGSDGLDLYVHRVLQREGFATIDGVVVSPSPLVERGPGGEVAGERSRGSEDAAPPLPPREGGRGGEASVPVFANHAEMTPTGLRITFPYADEECRQCGNCKAKHVRALRRQYDRVIYIGDGYSDRCASAEADILFAKSHLAEICDAEGRDYVPFSTFADILARLA